MEVVVEEWAKQTVQVQETFLLKEEPFLQPVSHVIERLVERLAVIANDVQIIRSIKANIPVEGYGP